MVVSFRTICLLVVLIATVTGTGCASSYRTHPEWSQRKSAIRNIGLLPPMVTMYGWQSYNQLVVNDEGSLEANESLSKAFVDEMAAGSLSLTTISGESREVDDIADLSKAVDLSIGRHAYANNTHETFREKEQPFDYSLGSAREMMERHQVDVVWVVTGYHVPLSLQPERPTRDPLEIAVRIFAVGVMGGPYGISAHQAHQHLERVGGDFPVRVEVEFRAALIDKSGTILFYYRDWPSSGDLRDPRFARDLVRDLLSEYRKAVAQ